MSSRLRYVRAPWSCTRGTIEWSRSKKRLLATLIPDAHFVLLKYADHILLEQELAWDVFRFEIEAFLGTDTQPSPRSPSSAFSGRELEVLELVSEGLTNEAIADRLCLSAELSSNLTNISPKLHVSSNAAVPRRPHCSSSCTNRRGSPPASRLGLRADRHPQRGRSADADVVTVA